MYAELHSLFMPSQFEWWNSGVIQEEDGEQRLG